MGNRLVIIDGNSLINRAYYAMQRPMITKEGIYTQGIFGFLNMLTKIQDDYSPDYLAVAWDRKAPTFRHEEYKDYKAGRKKMPVELAMELPLIKDILDAMHIPNLEIDGFEADDIIGTVARIGEEEGMSPLIITGDKDALQLATDTTHVLITKKGISEFDLYDQKKMIERYQLTPEQFIDLKGLMGDQSDNIPGIPGVGEKTGIKLLTQFGSVANLIANTDQIANEKLRQKVEDNVQLALMSRKLATINTYVPLEIDLDTFKTREPDYDALIDIYSKLEFNRFLKQLNTEGHTGKIEEEFEDKTEYKMLIISEPSHLKNLEDLSKDSPVFLHVFGDGNHVGTPQIIGVALLQGEQYYYINGSDENIKGLVDIFNKENIEFCGHQLIRDYYMLMRVGLNHVETAFDTVIAQYVIDPTKSSYNLKVLALELLHTDIPDEKEILEQSGQTDLFGNNDEQIAQFGLEWCKTCVRLMKLQGGMLKEQELEKVFYTIELPLIAVLASMENIGFDVKEEELSKIGETMVREISDLEQTIYHLAGETFNINSPSQLGVVLFENMGLPAGKKTKRGYSTSADVLEKLKDKHPIIELILKYRTMTKLNSTYVQGLKPLIGNDKKIRAHFQQTVTATGRISCTEPNLQNIPVRHDIGRQLRKAFTAGDVEHILIGADYSQIELRILAHLSGDENLIAAFNNGDDIHRNTAARVFNIDYGAVTPLDRSRAKAVNFGVIYGMSGFGLSEELKITRKDAEKYIRDYFDKHKAVKAYMDEQVALCKDRGYSETILGRKRAIHEINSSNYMVRQLGERLAMNSPIQGSAADIIKIAMIKVYDELRKNYPDSKLILQVHDELIIKAPKRDEEAIKKLLVDNMEQAMDLLVKLECDLNEGSTWYELK